MSPMWTRKRSNTITQIPSGLSIISQTLSFKDESSHDILHIAHNYKDVGHEKELGGRQLMYRVVLGTYEASYLGLVQQLL